MPLPAVAIAALVGTALGALKGSEDRKSAAQQRKVNAEMMRNSPWTGMQPSSTYVQDPSMMGSMVQGGLSGATFGMDKYFNPTEATTAGSGSASVPASGVEKTPVEFGTGGAPMSPAGFDPNVKYFESAAPTQANLVAPGETRLMQQQSGLQDLSPWERMQLIKQIQGGNYA
jgi:hypothetical protein